MYTFTSSSITVKGKTFPAEYSVTPSGAVVVFVQQDSSKEPARIRFNPDHADHAAALAAARGETPEDHSNDKQPAQCSARHYTWYSALHLWREAGPTLADGKSEYIVWFSPGVATAYGKNGEFFSKYEQEAPADAVSMDETPEDHSNDKQPAQEQEQVQPEAPAAVPVDSKTARGPVPEKPFVGSAIQGNGWKILFDGRAERTRIIFDNAPTAAAKAAIEKAGFYFSSVMGSWNKKLTFKAYRAAQALSAELSVIYA